MKRRLSNAQYEFLKRELTYLQEIGKLSPEQAADLLSSYEAGKIQKERKIINFVQVLTAIGAILIGLGILSFVASNWQGLKPFTKFGILLLALVATYLIAKWLEPRKPLFARSFYYIGIFAYGAEIFYIGQLFHLGGSAGTAFFLWSLGSFALAYYLRDKYVYTFSFLLFYIFIELEFMLIPTPSYWLVVIIPLLFAVWHYFFKQSKLLLAANFLLLYQFIELKFVIEAVEKNQFPYVLTVLLPVLFYAGHRWMNRSQLLFFVNLLFVYQWISVALYYFQLDRLVFFVLPYFIIGIIMTHKQWMPYQEVMQKFGQITQFVAGLLLTLKFTWVKDLYEWTDNSLFPVWAAFGVLYIVYGFWLVYRNKLLGIVVVSAVIFRFYVDLSLMFLNKSIAFFIGGILLLLFGYWFEKTRRGEKKRGKTTVH